MIITNKTFDNEKKIHFSLVKPYCSAIFVSCDDALFNTKLQMFIFIKDDFIEYTHFSQIAELQVYKGDTLIRTDY